MNPRPRPLIIVAAAGALALSLSGCGSRGHGSPQPSVQGPCVPECAVGLLKCGVTGPMRCVEPNGSCAAWQPVAPCPEGQGCLDGRCVEARPCPEPCPPGSFCAADGVCTTDGSKPLVIDIPAVRVHVSILLDGAPLWLEPGAGDMAALAFTPEPEACPNVPTAVSTNQWPSAGELSTSVVPCTYRVTFANGSPQMYPASNFLADSFTAPRPIVIGPNDTEVVLDIQTYSVRGVIRVNARLPARDPTCGSEGPLGSTGYVRFTGEDGAVTLVKIPCDTPDFAFESRLAAGTYRIEVEIPETPRHALDCGRDRHCETGVVALWQPLVVSGAIPDLRLNVPIGTLVGKTRLNGDFPEVAPQCLRGAARVTLTEQEGRAGAEVVIPCSTADFGFSLPLPAGNYDVYLEALDSNLPSPSARVARGLTVLLEETTRIIDVQAGRLAGEVVVNGAPAGCDSSKSPLLVLIDPATGKAINVPLTCPGATLVPTMVVPGHFTAHLWNLGPSGWTFSGLDVVVAAPETRVRLDFSGAPTPAPTPVTVAGHLQRNGQQPHLDGCDELESPVARVLFDPTSSGSVAAAFVDCANPTFAFAASILPGVYDVVVEAYGSDLPRYAPMAVIGGLPVDGPIADLVLDLPVMTLTGRVLVNGRTPSPDGNGRNPQLEFAPPDWPWGAGSIVMARSPRGDIEFTLDVPPGVWSLVARNVVPITGYRPVRALRVASP